RRSPTAGHDGGIVRRRLWRSAPRLLAPAARPVQGLLAVLVGAVGVHPRPSALHPLSTAGGTPPCARAVVAVHTGHPQRRTRTTFGGPVPRYDWSAKEATPWKSLLA